MTCLYSGLVKLPFVRAALVIGLVVALCAQAKAQISLPVQGQRSLFLAIGGKSVRCTSAGRPVIWVANYQLNDVGFTRASSLAFLGTASLEIEYNPTVLLNDTADIALFWLGHECGHAYNQTANESEADCWSAKTGVRQGWFTSSDFEQLKVEMKDNQGDITHPPGPERMKHVRECMELGGSHDSAGNSESSAEPIADPDPAASACVEIDLDHLKLDWHKTAADHTVDYRYRYHNSCDKPVVCSIKIAVGNHVKGADGSAWTLTAERTTRVTFGPKEEKIVSGSLEWDLNRPHNSAPSMRFSDTTREGDFAERCKYVAP